MPPSTGCRRGLAAAFPPEAPVHVYFNNDPGGAAIVDAIAFAAACRRSGLIVTRTPGVSGSA